MRFINDKVHGVLDYAVALTLVAAPFALGFSAVSPIAHWFSVVAGIGLFAYSAVTAYSLSAQALISFPMHLALDASAGLAFVVAPFAVGFDGVPRIFYLVVGSAVLAVVLLTRPVVTPAPAT